jgi:hypothetical protein
LTGNYARKFILPPPPTTRGRAGLIKTGKSPGIQQGEIQTPITVDNQLCDPPPPEIKPTIHQTNENLLASTESEGETIVGEAEVKPLHNTDLIPNISTEKEEVNYRNPSLGPTELPVER